CSSVYLNLIVFFSIYCSSFCAFLLYISQEVLQLITLVHNHSQPEIQFLLLMVFRLIWLIILILLCYTSIY
ncbi:unnamed protein product, partial [Prunus brigantina]